MQCKTTTSAIAALIGLGLASMGSAASAQQVYPAATTAVQPVKDAFYVSPSTNALAGVQPGTVLRYRTTPHPYGSRVSQAYQLMFRSTDGSGNPVVMVTTLLMPAKASATGRKLLSYQSMYDSLQLNCTPSGLTTSGKLFEKGYVNTALDQGVVVVLTDYEGLQSQWIAGMNTAHGVLDGIRAVEKFSKSGLNSHTPVGLMGYSGGGHATGWANEVALEYAPELNIVGAAMGGLPVSPLNVAKKVDGGLFAGVYFGAVLGLSRANPQINVNDYASPAGLTMLKDMANRCLLGMMEGQPEILTPYAFKKGSQYLQDPNFLDLPEMQAIGVANTMGSRPPKAPMYIYEGAIDEVMPIADVDALVKTYCARGQKVQYNRYAVADHMMLAIAPDAGMNYVLDRLNGKAAPSNCN